MLDFWNNLIKDDARDYLDELIHEKNPFRIYLTARGAFYDLHSLTELAIDGCLEEGGELEFSNSVGIPVSAIIAYCDTNTSINTQCLVELMHAIYAEITTVKTYGEIKSVFPYGPKRSPEELGYLNRQLWIIQHRLGNHLYSIMSEQERKQAQEEPEDTEEWAPAMTRDRLCRILKVENQPISKKTLSRYIKNGSIKTSHNPKGAKSLIVRISDLPRGWENTK